MLELCSAALEIAMYQRMRGRVCLKGLLTLQRLHSGNQARPNKSLNFLESFGMMVYYVCS